MDIGSTFHLPNQQLTFELPYTFYHHKKCDISYSICTCFPYQFLHFTCSTRFAMILHNFNQCHDWKCDISHSISTWLHYQFLQYTKFEMFLHNFNQLHAQKCDISQSISIRKPIKTTQCLYVYGRLQTYMYVCRSICCGHI